MEKEIFFDKNLMDIREGDLLKVYHFRNRRKIFYMYHVVVFNPEINMLECKDYKRDGNKGHYRLKSLCDKQTNVYLGAEIVQSSFHKDLYKREQSARKRRKSNFSKST